MLPVTFLLKLVRQSRPLLQNWDELIFGTIREFQGKPITETPILKFRNGLNISMARGGYGGFYLLFPEIFVDNCYEPTPDFAIQDGWNVLDIGANMGFYSCKAGGAAKNVHLIAVEPVEGYYKTLKANLQSNNIRQGIALHAAAVGVPTDHVEITSWFTASGEQKVLMSDPPAGARTLTETVRAMTLDEILTAGSMEHCDLMKMDIEGAEFSIFESIPSAVWNKIDRVVMETHETEKRTQQRLVDVLTKQGFSVSTQPMFLYAIRPELVRKASAA